MIPFPSSRKKNHPGNVGIVGVFGASNSVIFFPPPHPRFPHFFPFLFFSWHSPTRGFGNWWVYQDRQKKDPFSLFFFQGLPAATTKEKKQYTNSRIPLRKFLEFFRVFCREGGRGSRTFSPKIRIFRKVITRSRSRQSVTHPAFNYFPKCQIFFSAASRFPIFLRSTKKSKVLAAACPSFEKPPRS